MEYSYKKKLYIFQHPIACCQTNMCLTIKNTNQIYTTFLFRCTANTVYRGNWAKGVLIHLTRAQLPFGNSGTCCSMNFTEVLHSDDTILYNVIQCVSYTMHKVTASNQSIYHAKRNNNKCKIKYIPISHVYITVV